MDGINIREYRAPNTENPQGGPVKYFTDTNHPPPPGSELVKEIPPMQAGGASGGDPYVMFRQSVVDRMGFDPDTYNPVSEAQKEINMGLGQKLMLHTFGRELAPNQMTEQQQQLFRKNIAKLKSDLLKKHTLRAIQGKQTLKQELDYWQQRQEEATKRFSAEMKAAAKMAGGKERKQTDILAGAKYLKDEYGSRNMLGDIIYRQQGGQEAYNVASRKYLDILKQKPDIGTVDAARQAHNYVVGQEKKYWQAIQARPEEKENIDRMYKQKFGYIPYRDKQGEKKEEISNTEAFKELLRERFGD